MSDDMYLDAFPMWIRSLGDDAEDLSAVLEEGPVPVDAKELIAGGINYLFKSLDLIPDGIDNIGYLDDAFVLRICADLASKEGIAEASSNAMQVIGRLANEADLIREFLLVDYNRLETYVKGLRRTAARGRSVNDIVTNDEIRADLLGDVHRFAKSYSAPGFTRDEKNLIKLKAFFDAKLPK